MKRTTFKDKHVYIVVMCDKPRFVTDMDYGSRTARWELTGIPYEFNDYDEAANVCCGLAWHGTLAYPVILRYELKQPLYDEKEVDENA